MASFMVWERVFRYNILLILDFPVLQLRAAVLDKTG